MIVIPCHLETGVVSSRSTSTTGIVAVQIPSMCGRNTEVDPGGGIQYGRPGAQRQSAIQNSASRISPVFCPFVPGTCIIRGLVGPWRKVAVGSRTCSSQPRAPAPPGRQLNLTIPQQAQIYCNTSLKRASGGTGTGTALEPAGLGGMSLR